MDNFKLVYDYIIMSNYFEPFATCEIRFNEKTNKNEIYVIYANKHFPCITGVPNDEILNKRLTEIFFQKSTTIFDWTRIIAEAAMTNSYKVIEDYFDSCNKFLKMFVFGYNMGVFHVIIKDETEKKENKRILFEKNKQIDYLIEEVRIKNNNDNLTKLYDYQFGLDSVDLSISDYNELGTNFTVLLLDLIGLRTINQDYGYEVGDKTLIEIADMLLSNTRKIDIPCRYSGGKFFVIYNNVNTDLAQVLIEKLKISIKKNIRVLHIIEIFINGAALDYSGQTKTELMTELESKLEKAKCLGADVIL
ncbi:GGDEF domain-containing protein [Sedimentibacter sp. zth1]|uniref:GGDEF domain-containing protein n=1 Tax=Sedimentibacter sp. zth1 TaxID=2816908 RepID=UPI001A9283C3|nr:GGDEF domain-containing protein [Sedimentibacter sp. zth1]QSX05296.1 GGDEF domain-containing protein [Sedimentibacter sp. zth1]